MSTFSNAAVRQANAAEIQESPCTHAADALGAEAPAARWSLAHRVAFRFLFSYVVLYTLPFPLGADPYTLSVSEAYETIWHAVVPWVASHVLVLEHPITIFTNGSGDTTYDYVKVLCFLAIAAAAAIVWSMLDRRRGDYERLDGWLRTLVRLFLASMMIVYGSEKVFQAQFPAPLLDRLVQPVGDVSPMGLLWTFMGASRSYNLFAGSVEVIGGILLFVPRLTTLGALVSAGAMANVFMLNLSYDVPVKLGSGHLLALSLLLVLPDLRRLADVLVLDRPTRPAARRPLFERRWLQRTAFALTTLFGVYLVGTALVEAYTYTVEDADPASKSPFYGIWNAEEVTVDGTVRPPLVSDASRWRRVIFDSPDRLSVQPMSDALVRYRLDLDTEGKVMKLSKGTDPDWGATLTFDTPAPDVLALDGTIDGHAMHAQLRRAELPTFTLTTRGFHWVSEYPFSR